MAAARYIDDGKEGLWDEAPERGQSLAVASPDLGDGHQESRTLGIQEDHTSLTPHERQGKLTLAPLQSDGPE